MTYQVVYKSMPSSVEALSIRNLDDNYTIILNINLSSEMQRKAFIHEIRHILRGDFYKIDGADRIERNIS